LAKALMFQGTGSDVGKTLLVAGLCRALSSRGLRVTPFKPQNMSNNAAVAADGGEIGRGQALQAFAARIAPSIHMNPVLLKPQAQGRAQIIAQGRVLGAAGGADYQSIKFGLLSKVLESYYILAGTYDYILAEGAGSPAEINLRQGDIANMGFAESAGLPVLLVGDIDRGGVIAALAGTRLVLPLADRARIIGYVINKFRGQRELFADGVKAIQHFTGWECFGIVPWLEAARLLPAEDSLSLSYQKSGCIEADSALKWKLRIIVPVSKHIANFDDFDPLRHEPEVELIFTPMGVPLPKADIIMLGGSKAALADMEAFHASGRAEEICRHAAAGGVVIGLCGGFQMLGRVLRDSGARESSLREIPGLGLLDIETDLEAEKIVGQRMAQSRFYGGEVSGYEIHCGRSFGADCGNAPFIIGGRYEGAASPDRKVWGTYLHGIFHNGAFRQNFLRAFAVESDGRAHNAKLDKALDSIAETLEAELNINRLIDLMR